jgi:hypothetical protein
MTLPELAERSLRLLGQIIDQAHEELQTSCISPLLPSSFTFTRETFAPLAKTCLPLKLRRNSEARESWRARCPTVSSLWWPRLKIPGSQRAKVIAEQQDQIRRIKMWIGEKPPSEFQEKIEEAKREIRDIEQRCPQQKGWQVGSSRRYPPQASGMTTTLPLRFERGSLCLSRSFHG